MCVVEHGRCSRTHLLCFVSSSRSRTATAPAAHTITAYTKVYYYCIWYTTGYIAVYIARDIDSACKDRVAIFGVQTHNYGYAYLLSTTRYFSNMSVSSYHINARVRVASQPCTTRKVPGTSTSFCQISLVQRSLLHLVEILPNTKMHHSHSIF